MRFLLCFALAFAACATPSTEGPTSPARRLVDGARACVIARGDGAGPVSWTSAVLEPAEAGGPWKVRFAGTGEVELPTRSCPAAAADLQALVTLTRSCANEAGLGVGGTPLVVERVSLHWSIQNGAERLVASFPEQQGTSVPTGRELIIDPATGRCAPALMD